jgi:hypothetical protein
VRVDLDALAGAQILQRLAGQMTVIGKALHRVVDVAIRRRIGMTALDQVCDHVQHLADIFGGARLMVRRLHPQRRLSACMASMKRWVSAV